MISFPQRLERQASSVVANLDLPAPNSGNFLLRLARFPNRGTETILDVIQQNHRILLKVTRILVNLRKPLVEGKFEKKIPVEISFSYIDQNEPLVQELSRDIQFQLVDDLENSMDGNHFFLFYTDSIECIAKAISNPHEKVWAEAWQRLINRSYGTEHVVPRRHARICNLLQYE